MRGRHLAVVGGTLQEAYRREWGKQVRRSWRNRIRRTHGERDATWTSNGDERGSRRVYNTSDVLILVGAELIAEAEDAVGAGFRGVEVILGVFEGSESLDGEIFWKAFDREAGKIVGHS